MNQLLVLVNLQIAEIITGQKLPLTSRQRLRGLLLTLVIGLIICFWGLGQTGLVDETPPLFAASARVMARTGDWLTPRVNGLPRFDKPPFVYWLMGVGYALPSRAAWDPLGTWAARFPSALATLITMLMLADTIMILPQLQDTHPRQTALSIALAFALSPLILLWNRIAVSDALLCGTLTVSLLFQWRRFAMPKQQSWWPAWLVLGLAVLTKGPIAIGLTLLTLVLFAALTRQSHALLVRLCPVRGLLLTVVVSLPWYAAELIVEGEPFWTSFFVYHNIQRLTSVVNNHLQPWWFFLPLMLLAALPFSLLLILGFAICLKRRLRRHVVFESPSHSLATFASSWLLATFLFFTAAATKLPSYWLPATPAAAILIGLSTRMPTSSVESYRWAWRGTAGLTLLLAIALFAAPIWIPLISDSEMPTLSGELLASQLVLRAATCILASGVLGLMLPWRPYCGHLLTAQIPLIIFQVIALVPMISLGDKVRQLPIRQVAELVRCIRRPGEPLAMVGVMKPSLHFYADQIVLYEGRSERALVNLSDRLQLERRYGWLGYPSTDRLFDPSTLLIVIDQSTIARSHWQGLQRQRLGHFGIYEIWRLRKSELEQQARLLNLDGKQPDWRQSKPERY